jgi:DNA mismatch repair protein MutS2
VLLDELGTNTDPGEGSALGRAILLHFLSQRTMTVATTHYTELKALAHATDGMENAALDVDPVTMAPTYHLTVGIPGGSNALATASRLGLPEEIVARARHMLSQGAQEIESLLTHLVTEQKNVESLRHSLEKELDEAEHNDAELKNRLHQLEEEKRRIIKETRDRMGREVADLQMTIREAAAELRKEKSKERIEQARKALTEAQERLNAGVWQPRPAAEIDEAEAGTGPITAGDTVWLIEAGVPATVLSVSEERGLVEVYAGKVKMTLRLDSVEKRIPATGGVKTGGAMIKKEMRKSRVSLELDLRGKRAEEVEPLLDDYLNGASLGGLSRVRIIHGIGTGTVRQIVRETLASHPLVTSFQPGEQGEGGDGVTIVSM